MTLNITFIVVLQHRKVFEELVPSEYLLSLFVGRTASEKCLFWVWILFFYQKKKSAITGVFRFLLKVSPSTLISSILKRKLTGTKRKFPCAQKGPVVIPTRQSGTSRNRNLLCWLTTDASPPEGAKHRIASLALHQFNVVPGPSHFICEFRIQNL